MAEWIDLLDPTPNELRGRLPVELYPGALEQLAAPSEGREPRPRITGGEGYIVAFLLAPVAVEAEDRIYYQEIDLVLTPHTVVTVRKTPPGETPFDIAAVRGAGTAERDASPGFIAYRLLDDIAERYLALEDALNAEIDELEDNMENWLADRIQRRLSDLRHDILHIRRTLTPTRDAVRRVVDGRLDVGDEPLVPERLRPAFGEAYDKLLRASEALDFARDLVGAAREYHQSRVAQEQNDVIKKLAVIASVLLLPTFIVGNYGQNFVHMPELEWRLGYAFSWALIVLTTIAQLVFYRSRRWI